LNVIATPYIFFEFTLRRNKKFPISNMDDLIDHEHQDFRDYLEKSGTLSYLTRVLFDMFNEKERPSDPLGYIRTYLGVPLGTDIDSIKQENEELKLKCEELEATIDALLGQLESLRPLGES